MEILLTPGLLCALAGCACLYLASPNQRWLASPWRARPARMSGTLLLGAGLAALWQAVQPVVAVFVWCTWLMLVFVLLPYLGALRPVKGGR